MARNPRTRLTRDGACQTRIMQVERALHLAQHSNLGRQRRSIRVGRQLDFEVGEGEGWLVVVGTVMDGRKLESI